MKAITLFSLIMLITSCATKQIILEPNKNLWIGRNADEVILHPVFATMPMDTRKTEQGLEIRTFKNGGITQSSASCYGNNCGGVAMQVSCSHIFYIEKNKINDYKRSGQCSEEQIQFRPQDKDGNPLFTESELEQYNSGRSTASEKNCGIAGKIFGC